MLDVPPGEFRVGLEAEGDDAGGEGRRGGGPRVRRGAQVVQVSRHNLGSDGEYLNDVRLICDFHPLFGYVAQISRNLPLYPSFRLPLSHSQRKSFKYRPFRSDDDPEL